MALTNKLTDIVDAIRDRTGESDAMTIDQMPNEIRSIKEALIVDDGVLTTASGGFEIDEDGYILL